METKHLELDKGKIIMSWKWVKEAPSFRYYVLAKKRDTSIVA